MTEAEWRACDDPEPMLAFVRGWAGRRKLRLFEAACGGQVWTLLEDGASERAVEVTLLDADGLANPETLRQAARAANDAWARLCNLSDSDDPTAPLLAANVAYLLLATPAERERWSMRRGATPHALAAEALAADARDRIRHAERPVSHATAEPQAYRHALAAARRAQADFLRDLFGNPFRLMCFDPAWISWGGGVIPNLAQAVYDEQAFGRLPVLADALADAGCDNAELIAHCRGPGPHVRGCWAVDLILSKDR